MTFTCSCCKRFLPACLFARSEKPKWAGGSYPGRQARRCFSCVTRREAQREGLRTRLREGRREARKLVKRVLGGLPDHWFVVFKNGDNFDVRLQNLLVVTGPNRRVVRQIVGRRQYGLYGKIDMAHFVEQREAVQV